MNSPVSSTHREKELDRFELLCKKLKKSFPEKKEASVDHIHRKQREITENESNTKYLAWSALLLKWLTYGATKQHENISQVDKYDYTKCRLRIFHLRLMRDRSLCEALFHLLRHLCDNTNLTEVLIQTGIPGEIGFAYELWDRMMLRLANQQDHHREYIHYLFNSWLIETTDIDWLFSSEDELKAIFYLLEVRSNNRSEDCFNKKQFLIKFHDALKRAILTLSFDITSEGLKAKSRQFKSNCSGDDTSFLNLSIRVRRFISSKHKENRQKRDSEYHKSKASIIRCKSIIKNRYQILINEGTNPTAIHRLQRMNLELDRLMHLIEIIASNCKSIAAQELLYDLIEKSHQQSQLIPMIKYNAKEFTKRIVAKHAELGHHYIAESLKDFQILLKKAILGGIIAAPIVINKILIYHSPQLSSDMHNVLETLNYAFFFS